MQNPYSTLDELDEAIVACRACPRLVTWREEVAITKRRAYQDQEYWGKAVPGFGDPQARLLLVGMAPGAHGANRTGRVFTGDGSGDFLFAALYRAGFANQPQATGRGDGLELRDCYITGVARCVPPQNRPTPQEIANCRPFFQSSLLLLDQVKVILPLGQIAFDHTLRALREMGYDLPRLDFGHGLRYDLADFAGDGPLGRPLPQVLIAYHPSRQNTQTGVLTAAMMDEIFASARRLIESGESV
ncbi:MAG: uracil-DNA glycosylase [Caldilineaceae bacterium]|nr:uracil-DNA glycosylase [Caldilineaceae bacterium]